VFWIAPNLKTETGVTLTASAGLSEQARPRETLGPGGTGVMLSGLSGISAATRGRSPCSPDRRKHDQGRVDNTLKRRAEIMKALRESYDYGARVWEGRTEKKALEMAAGRGGQQVPRWAAILGAIQDNMNHHGNLVVYLRLNGRVPPRSASRN